jgi:hypothetical protein
MACRKRHAAFVAIVWFLLSQSSLATARDVNKVRDLVLIDHRHGIPYEQVHSLGPSALPDLRSLLSDPAQKRHWGNVILAIGVISNEQSFDVLQSFLLTTYAGAVDEETFRALASVPTAMGMLRSRDAGRAKAFLMRGARPDYWARLPWSTTHFPTTSHRDFYFSKLCINAMGYLGTPEAGTELAAMQRKPIDQGHTLVLKTAIRRNTELLATDLNEYFKRHSAPQ